jgi:hypothetical protein
MTVTLVRPARARSSAAVGPRALVRVRPAPSMDPPFDDEPDRSPPVQPNLPEPEGSGLDPLIEAWNQALPDSVARADSVQRRAAAYRMVRGYLDRALEVVDGFRPVGHLRPLTDPARFDEVASQLARLRAGRPPLPTRPTSGVVRVGVDRVRLRHLRVCEIGDAVLEGAAVLGRGERVRALALRLERRSGAWLCTHLQVL